MAQMQIPSIEEFEALLIPLENELKQLNLKLKEQTHIPKFYRNKDLKQIFGLSDNTIAAYREKGNLPYTRIGDIILYPVDKLNEILLQNSYNR
ncbi:MAG: helix-turn-helix domain-containing protein [Bacteroidia bacterium]